MTMTPIQIAVVMAVPANQSTMRRIARTSRRISPVRTRPVGMRARPNPRSRAREERRESHPDRAHNSGRTTRRMVTTATTVVSLMPQLFHTVVTFVRRGHGHGHGRQASVSWRSASVRQVSAPLSPTGGDRGDADPRVRAALAACLTDDPDTYRNAYLEAISTLCAGVRLFMPVMTDEVGEIGAVKLTNGQGSTALLAFTGIDSLTAWDSRA